MCFDIKLARDQIIAHLPKNASKNTMEVSRVHNVSIKACLAFTEIKTSLATIG